MAIFKLTRSQKEELLIHQFSKSIECLLKKIDELVAKYANEPESKYNKIHIEIKDGFFVNTPTRTRFEKFYPASSAKSEIAIDMVSNFSSIVRSIEDTEYWTIVYGIYFYKSDGTLRGSLNNNEVNPDAWNSEFFKIKGWDR